MTEKVKSVLLIGGAGFLGLHLIQQFYDMPSKPQICVFDVRPLPEKLSKQFTFDPEAIEFFKGDLTSEDSVTEAIKLTNANVVVHAASPVHGGEASIYELVNVKGTRNILDVCKKTGVSTFVYTSSAGVIFNGQDVHNADETWPIPEVPMDAYNETKAIAEDMVLKANDPTNGFYTVALRPAGIFGPGDRQLVPGLRTVAKLGQSKFQIGDNNNLFDWTYAGNVADAHVLAAEKLLNPETRDNVAGETFFITNDTPSYFWALARTVWKADNHIDKRVIVLKRPVAILAGYLSEFFSKLLGKEPGLTPFRVKIVCASRYHNISKAKKYLGYEPRVDIEQGIMNTLAWMDEGLE
ncbi:similar to Saccharomyces cerevisiae YGL001C ERG26 C-3 sterol dehydrogenase [Maudiozyma saulgeensis]|uniref:Sterol-4-alpha-carboxylate 3-dehydrogenase ERG26, decarboxylating n=1 Tax=Maudiozyma saulgeensis TaxID=1789683 RepID=A0A1X7RA57_9SACH|nr:similar to Saccharomyces cerevisiae YGL001C ERG26 C-3 sterol dehydrogenase [Kazachstania saulgeensis]